MNALNLSKILLITKNYKKFNDIKRYSYIEMNDIYNELFLKQMKKNLEK
jgi:hypothetical protein